MKRLRHQKRSLLPLSSERVYKWLSREGSMYRIAPMWMRIRDFRMKEGRDGALASGVRCQVNVWGRWMNWETLVTEVEEGKEITRVELEGIFRYFRHRIRLIPEGDGSCYVEDEFEYTLPFSEVTHGLMGGYMRGHWERVVEARNEIMREDMVGHYMYAPRRLKIGVLGGGGFVGTELKYFLRSQGHEVVEFSHNPREGAYSYNYRMGIFPKNILENMDAVVNLAGVNIVDYWNKGLKKEIYESRVRTTEFLAKKIVETERRPVLINASAINIYGYSRQERLHEESSLGREGFLTEVAKEWEKATRIVEDGGTRVVNLRIGVVLHPRGGMLGHVLPIFRFGLGGRLGTGMQHMSWIGMDDLLDIIYFGILNDGVRGAVNATSPFPCTNFQFKQTLGNVLGRPAVFQVPEWALKLVLGEVSKEAILSDLTVIPQKLIGMGFRFRQPHLEGCLRRMLK